MTLVARCAAHTDIGLQRATNEDSFLVDDPVFAVADGMGGAQAGEVASKIATDTLAARLAAGDGLEVAVQAANAKVFAQASSDSEHFGMGTTATVVRLSGDEIEIAQVGDSRVYLLRDGSLEQLTHDHSLINEWLEAGSITPDEVATSRYRSVLTRALGTEAEVEVDRATMPVRAGDVLLLSTDGLHGLVPEKTIAAALAAHRDPERCVRELVREAKNRGGTDNITAVVVRLEEGADDQDEAGSPAAAAAGDDVEAAETPEGSSTLPGPDAGHADEGGGAGREPVAPAPRRLLLALLIVALVAVIIVGLVAGTVVVGNLYFVGVNDGRVAVFRGLPYEIGGVKLFRVYKESAISIDAVRLDLRERIEANDVSGERGARDLYVEVGGTW